MSTVQGGQGNIVTNGLILNLDAANPRSYAPPFNGTTWQNLVAVSSSISGSLVNGVGYTGSNGGTLVFDGVDDFVTGGNSSNYIFGTGDFTISYWAYVNAFSGTGTPTFIDFRSSAAPTPGYADYVQANKFKLYISGADVYTSTGSLSTGSWYNITTTRQSTTLSVYFNGRLDGTSLNSTNLTENGLLIARNINSPGTSYLNGRISSVLIYKGKALNASEVLQNFNATRARFGV